MNIPTGYTTPSLYPTTQSPCAPIHFGLVPLTPAAGSAAGTAEAYGVTAVEQRNGWVSMLQVMVLHNFSSCSLWLSEIYCSRAISEGLFCGICFN